MSGREKEAKKKGLATQYVPCLTDCLMSLNTLYCDYLVVYYKLYTGTGTKTSPAAERKEGDKNRPAIQYVVTLPH